MFNNYIAKKRELNLFKKLESTKQQIQWKNKYLSEIRPQLLDSYQQRVNSFMYQMRQNPILIQEDTKMQACLQRSGGFIYKNCEDWKSFQTISQRLYLKSKSKDHQKYSNTSRKGEFSPNNTEYRIRNKSKQINRPMKFGKLVSETAQHQRGRHHSLQIARQSTKRQQQSMENDNETIYREVTSKESDANSDFFESRGRVDDIDVDRDEQQRKNKSHQYKRHFKKLMSLSLIGEQKYKKQIRSILNKCGYIKKKEKNNSQVQVDQLARIVQKIRQK